MTCIQLGLRGAAALIQSAAQTTRTAIFDAQKTGDREAAAERRQVLERLVEMGAYLDAAIGVAAGLHGEERVTSYEFCDDGCQTRGIHPGGHTARCLFARLIKPSA